MFSLPMRVERSIVIEKSIQEVQSVVSDFSHWTAWSPWLCQEPDCPVERKGSAGQVGHSQSWNGNRIGSGSITITEVKDGQYVNYDLNIIKPWKSQSKVQFRFKDLGGKTEVHWDMDGSIPIFIFFLKKLMTSLVGSDYDRGLLMLKEYMEKGSVQSKVDVKGQTDRPGFFFVGKSREVSFDELGPKMELDFKELEDRVQSGKMQRGDFAVSFYHDWDLVNKKTKYTSGFAYSQPVNAPEDLESGEVSAHRALQVDHIGSYQHLGNGWSTAMAFEVGEKERLQGDFTLRDLRQHS